FEEENLFTEVFIFSISGFLLCKEVRDYELFLSILKKYSYFIVSISGVVLLFARVGSAYMGFSYAILLYILTLLYYGFFKGDKAAFIAGIIGSLIDIAGGTRGSLLCLFALFIGFLIFSKKWKICIVLCFSVLLIALNINPIVNLLYSITTSLGISSRILEALLGTNMSSISFTNGRTTITNVAFDLIKENTLGYGYLGERAYLNDRVWWFTTDGYAHNIFLEIILQFGIFFGFLLIVALIYLIFNFAIKFNANNAAFSIGIIYMCYCVHLMVSRSYTTTFEFWFLLGLLLQYNWKKLKFGGTSTWSI
ncbi:O-antigen ligase family protein, partial [Lacrimispora sp.]|uniref:O-antigen ligase family protein n=1 Tax=Lacrimispora sp. TaxID=2719234 RepID=UPI0028AEF643